MDEALRGHPYVKAPIDIACWDILGKAAGMPVYKLLGGAAAGLIASTGRSRRTRRPRWPRNVEGYRDQGYTKFQLKVGGDADAGHRAHQGLPGRAAAGRRAGRRRQYRLDQPEAARIVAAVADVDVYIEQPCPSYEECLSIRRRTARPFVLDEVVTGTDMLIRAIAEDAMDIINLKISKVGGLTKARLMRDICVDAGIPMTIEDTWGGDIVTAAIAHLARSTPKDFCFTATDFNSYGTVSIAEGAPERVEGRMTAADRPGLGITPRFEVLRQARGGHRRNRETGDAHVQAAPYRRLPRRRRGRRCHRRRRSAAAPGDTLWAQSRFIAQDETLRNFVLNEPRGGVFRHVNLLVPPKNPQAQMGWIIMEPADTPPMSGSNSICVATVLLDTGILPMTEPETRLTLEAPGGLIEVRADLPGRQGRTDHGPQPALLRGQARCHARSAGGRDAHGRHRLWGRQLRHRGRQGARLLHHARRGQGHRGCRPGHHPRRQ